MGVKDWVGLVNSVLVLNIIDEIGVLELWNKC